MEIPLGVHPIIDSNENGVFASTDISEHNNNRNMSFTLGIEIKNVEYPVGDSDDSNM